MNTQHEPHITHADDTSQGQPPWQPMPPLPDTQLATPIDPIGIPAEPSTSTKPLRDQDQRRWLRAWSASLLLATLLLLAGLGYFFWLN